MQPAEERDPPAHAHYIFVAAGLSHAPYTPGREIVSTLLALGIWLASPKTPFQKVIRAGDKAIFYVGGSKAHYFLGQATVAGPAAAVEAGDEVALERLGLVGFAKRIPLRGVHLWREALPLRPLVDRLNFVKNKRYYGLNLIKSVVRISEEDYWWIVGQSGLSE